MRAAPRPSPAGSVVKGQPFSRQRWVGSSCAVPSSHATSTRQGRRPRVSVSDGSPSLWPWPGGDVTAAIPLALELAPAAATTREMRATVWDALVRAGATDLKWVGMPGDNSRLQGAPKPPTAHLYVRLRPAIGASPEEIARFVQEHLAPALRDIRAGLPTVRLGVRVPVVDGDRIFALRLTDSPDDVRLALQDFERGFALDHPVVGWMAENRSWTPL